MSVMDQILTIPVINRVRRNHALEHATIHVLSSHIKNLSMVGRSTANCFYLYGGVTQEQVEQAVQEALSRLRAGEHELAVHPGCGTNLVTSSGIGGLAAFTVLSMVPRRGRFGFDRLPLAIVAIMAGVLVGQPLGMRLQENVTTNGDPGDLRVLGVHQIGHGKVAGFRVDTAS